MNENIEILPIDLINPAVVQADIAASNGIGHNSGRDSENIPILTAQEWTDSVAILKEAREKAKLDITGIRSRIYRAELSLLVPALQQAYVHRNSNALVKLVSGAGLSGPIKNALRQIIPNFHAVKEGKLVLDEGKTPPTHRSEKTGALLPVWDDSKWAFLKGVFHNEVRRGADPISDLWKEVFPSPEKTLDQLKKAFASNVESAKKKGLTAQDMLSILQEEMSQGNLVA